MSNRKPITTVVDLTAKSPYVAKPHNPASYPYASSVADNLDPNGLLNIRNRNSSLPKLYETVKRNTAARPKPGMELQKSLQLELFKLCNLRGASFIQQFSLCFKRSFTQQYRALHDFFYEMGVSILIALCLGYSLKSVRGSLYRGIFTGVLSLISPSPDELTVANTGFVFGMAICICSAPSGVNVFGPELAVFYREAAAGHNRAAYYWAKTIAAIPRLTLAALHFIGIVYCMINPMTPFWQMFLMIMLTYFGVYGVASIISILVRRENQAVLSTTVSFFPAILSGASPVIQGANMLLQVLFTISYNRWGLELFFSGEVTPFRGLYQVDETTVPLYGYTVDRPGLDLAYMALCKEQKVYQTPELNDILYLHFKGFSKIENLDLYTGLKSLWLEGNGISKIENIEMLSELRCLFLQQNCIETIENLDTLDKLDTLNVGNNLIKKIQGLENLKYLKTLQIQNNFLINYDDLAGLLDCPSITVLDLSNNKIEDPEIVSILEKMPNLAVLNLMGNPVIRKITNYRRIIVSKIKSLTYLDDRPIFDKERLTTDAWAVGGLEGERLERERIYEEEKKKQEANFEAMRIMQENGRKKRLEKYGKEQEPLLSEKMQGFKDEMLARIEKKDSEVTVDAEPAEQSDSEEEAPSDNATEHDHNDLLQEVYDDCKTSQTVEEHHVPPRNIEIQKETHAHQEIEPVTPKKILIEEISTERESKPGNALIQAIIPENKPVITDEDIKEANALQYQVDIEQSIPTILLNDSHLAEDIKYSAPLEQKQADKEIKRELARNENVSQESLLDENEKLVVQEMLKDCQETTEIEEIKIVQEVDDEIEVITTDGFSKQSTLVELDERKKAW
ncbi:hypothetical protein HDV06_005389 [Boothiomyces sp. JEL0866]|nr:hypothetical protein HDV06_005389 [Boothiomyces sp. JEL0866]